MFAAGLTGDGFLFDFLLCGFIDYFICFFLCCGCLINALVSWVVCISGFGFCLLGSLYLGVYYWLVFDGLCVDVCLLTMICVLVVVPDCCC